jgi:hypothetical protein
LRDECCYGPTAKGESEVKAEKVRQPTEILYLNRLVEVKRLAEELSLLFRDMWIECSVELDRVSCESLDRENEQCYSKEDGYEI